MATHNRYNFNIIVLANKIFYSFKMNLIEELTDSYCIFCAKDASQSILSNMNTKTSLVGTENIDFSTIVYDVVQRKVKL